MKQQLEVKVKAKARFCSAACIFNSVVCQRILSYVENRGSFVHKFIRKLDLFLAQRQMFARLKDFLLYASNELPFYIEGENRNCKCGFSGFE